MAYATQPIEQLSINTIRTLAMDAVQAANSGHPGTPMALAPVAYVLWNEVLRYDPASRGWPDRDRFVLSCGHASMLLYSMLHLAGVKQLDEHGPSRPASWPCRWTTSAASASWAAAARAIPSTATPAASRRPPARWARASATAWAWRSPAAGWPPISTGPGFDLFDYNVYALCSDGDMMEGVSTEAASLAGHLKLLQPLLDLRRQHDHDRGPHVAGLQRGRRPRGSPAMAGTWSRWPTSTIWTPCGPPWRPSSRPTDRPTLIIVRS